jgi:hypothetical protein
MLFKSSLKIDATTFVVFIKLSYIYRGHLVERTGLEPVASALSKQRSEPTELTFRDCKFKAHLYLILSYGKIRKQF